MNRPFSADLTVRVLAGLALTFSLTGCATRNCHPCFPHGGGVVVPQSFAPGGTFGTASMSPPVMTTSAPGVAAFTQPTYATGPIMPGGVMPATAGVPLEALPTW
jgi:hypothetical protein